MNWYKDNKTRTFNIICYLFLGIFSVFCLMPFVLVVVASITQESDITKFGYSLIPKHISFEAYKLLLSSKSEIVNAYMVTIFITVVGTLTGLLMMSMSSYVMNRKDFKNRNKFAFYVYFTTLFNGGLVPFYILMVKYLQLKDNILAMILPGLVSAWSIFLMRNFMKSIPDSLYESAKIDGAGDFRIYLQIIMPLSLPAIATIGLFQALGYWNEWYNALLYIQTPSKYPLQYFLQNMMAAANVNNLVRMGASVDATKIPTESLKMATAVIVTGPVILLYPFLQKYFVSGLTMGAVKG